MSLLAGWVAFWLAVVAAPFCDQMIAKAQPGAPSVEVLESSDGNPSGGDSCYAPCPKLTNAQPARPAHAAAFTDSAPRVPDALSNAITLFVPAPAEPSRLLLTARPPAPVPFHLRTSRLQI